MTLYARLTTFSVPKDGSTAHEWEDCAAGRVDGTPRFMVVDGATEAYDALRWVDQLVTSFVLDAPALRDVEMRRWFAAMQERWVEQAPATFANLFEERKFHQDGSFATMLGCELSGMDGPTPWWEAVALGDTVLFHVREGRLVAHFPPLAPDDFGLAPDGVHTSPASLDSMMSRLRYRRGPVGPGDVLFIATDAMAHWMLSSADPRLFGILGDLDHPDVFAALVADRRASGALRNDDVTLMRIRLTADEPAFLVVCV